MKRFAMITVAALGALLATAPGALAGDVNCTAIMGGPINGNVVVPDGKSCTLAGATVTGNVKVGQGSTLVVESTTISGNIQADHCRVVMLEHALVGGNFQIQHCTSDSGYLDAHIGGDFQCHDNTAACVANGEGTAAVGGNVQVNNNVSSPGDPSQIFANSIAKNLQCQGNSPAPVGGGNTVAGNKEGQCAKF